jgi:hypothetical protein
VSTPDQPSVAEPEALRCAAHPQVETYLRCGRCGTPICPRCLIQTPVGARCRACARLRRLPIYDVGPRFLLRGGLAALATATLGRALLLVLPGLGLVFTLVLGGLLGVVVAEAVSRATRYKRGTSLGWVTVGATLLGYLLGRAGLAFVLLGGLPELARLSRAVATAFSPDLGHLLAMAMAAFIAYNRLR